MYNSENHVDLYILSTSPEGHSQEICQTKRIKGFNVLLFFFFNIYTNCLYFYYKNSNRYNQRISYIRDK